MGSRKPYDTRRKDVKFALDMGWVYCRHTGNGHLQFIHPATPIKLTLACTPGEGRGTANAISWIRRNTPRED